RRDHDDTTARARHRNGHVSRAAPRPPRRRRRLLRERGRLRELGTAHPDGAGGARPLAERARCGAARDGRRRARRHPALRALVGAGVAAIALEAGVAPRIHLVVATLALGASAAAVLGSLLPPATDTAAGEPHFARPTRAVLGLGFVAFLGLLTEGAMGDWSAV